MDGYTNANTTSDPTVDALHMPTHANVHARQDAAYQRHIAAMAAAATEASKQTDGGSTEVHMSCISCTQYLFLIPILRP